MARKKLLTESEIRRFMKLANMGPLGSGRLEEMGGYGDVPAARDDEEEEAMGAELSDMDSEADRERDEIEDLEGDLDVDDDELAADDMDMDIPGDDGLEDKLEAAIEAIVKAWDMEDVVSVEKTDEVDLDMDADEEVMDADEEVMDADVEMDMEMPAPDMGDEEEIAMDVDVMQEEIVNKVAKRVAQRLMKEQKQAQLADKLTERIFNRIVGKQA